MDNEVPLLSVIIPIYNVADYLAECLDSIINQTYKNLEIILVNDGSTDNSPEIIEEYKRKDPRIRVINKENGGLSSARNAGLDIMSGDYVIFVDSDDTLDITTIELNMKYFIEDTTLEMIQFPILFYWKSNKEFMFSPEKCQFKCRYQILAAGFHNSVLTYSACGKIYINSVFFNLRFSEGILYEDMFISSSLYKKMSNVMISQDGCYLYRYTEGSIMHSEFNFKKQKDLFLANAEIYKNNIANPFLLNSEKTLFLLNKMYWYLVHFFRDYSKEDKIFFLNIIEQYPIKFASILPFIFYKQISLKNFLRLFLISLFGLEKTHDVFYMVERTRMKLLKWK